MSKETLVDVFWSRVTNSPEHPAILHKVEDSYSPVIWREHGRVVELASGGLLKLGLREGEKVAIMSQTNPTWTWADIAILSCGAVSVPIYPTLSSSEIEYLLENSDTIGIFVENLDQLKKLLSIPKLPAKLRFVIVFNGIPEKSDKRLTCLTWRDLLQDGEVYLPNHPDELSKRITAIKPGNLASIVYTSGTTGVPKGAMLLHSNFYAVCQAICAKVDLYPDDICLSFLPLSHVYERVSGQFLSVYAGVIMAYAESIEKVPQNMVEVHPTILNGVPRFYEKAYQSIQTEVRKLATPQQYLIRWALALGRRAVKFKQSCQTSNQELALVEHIYRAELRVADRLVFSRIRKRFGGKLRIMASGAAPLAREVQDFFETIGMPVVEGYGLTETAAPACSNTPTDNKPGTVGKPLPCIELKLASDGEIMFKGTSVFAGYYKDEASTREAFRDGWFLTGDIGTLDVDGRLIIKDRKKDIIITAGGKHIAPQFIENLFKGDSLISHVLVYGDRRKFISALITLHKEALEEFARVNSLHFDSYAELIQNKLVVEAVEEAVGKRNILLATFERIKKFKILESDFSIEANELTPTLKIKRKVVTDRYKQILDSFYAVEDLELEGAMEG